MSTTPTIPAGERIAANAALLRLFKGEYRNSGDRHSDSLFVRDYVQQLEQEVSKHAPPPAAQPSDAAGLREVIQCAVVFGGECDDLPANKARALIDRILTALAPYLKGEPGDSERGGAE